MEGIGVIDLLAQAERAGLKVSLDNGELVVRGPRRAEQLAKAIISRKTEVLALLSGEGRSQTAKEHRQSFAHKGVLVSENIGACPHCSRPLIVFSQRTEAIVEICCPEGRLSKSLRLAVDESIQALCSDCSRIPALLCNRCPECIQRLLLCPEECPKCGGKRFWRHKANEDQPAGFAWYCHSCKPAQNKNIACFDPEA